MGDTSLKVIFENAPLILFVLAPSAREAQGTDLVLGFFGQLSLCGLGTLRSTGST